MTESPAAPADRGLRDTSVFIARERQRPLGPLPDATAISVITIAELHLGVLMADNPRVRAVRLRTLSAVQALFEPLPIDAAVAHAFAEIIAEARHIARTGRVEEWRGGLAAPFPPLATFEPGVPD